MPIPAALIISGKIGPLVYQKCPPGFGNDPDDPTRTRQIKAYRPTNTSATPAQILQRNRYKTACDAWGQTTQQQKTDYKARAARHAITGFNLFVSEFLRATQPPTLTNWDDGLTEWDAGATHWTD